MNKLKCDHCPKPATRWIIHKHKWLDFCEPHYEKFNKKVYPMLYEGQAKNQRSTVTTVTIRMAQFAGTVLFLLIAAYTVVGFFEL